MLKLLLLLLLLLGILLLSIVLFFSRFSLSMVFGRSMLPTYYEGDICIIDRKYKELKVGSIYCFQSPIEDKVLIKRCTYVSDVFKQNTALYLEGDNAEESHDSRHFGFVPVNLVIGEVVFTWKRRKQERTS